MRSWLVLGLLACRGKDATDTAGTPLTDTVPDGTTDPAGADVVSAECTLDPDNSLRATCSVDLDSPDDVEITFLADGVEGMVFRSAVPAARHVVEVWGLVQETEFQWAATPVGNPAGGQQGSLIAGSLPVTLDRMTVDVQAPGPHGDDAVLLNYGCDTFQEALVILDREGRVRWYQDISELTAPPGPKTVRGLNITPEGTILAVLDRTAVVEYALHGTLLLYLDGAALDHPVHHDLNRWNDLTYVVFAEQVEGPDGPTVTDGFYVFDGTGTRVAEWHSADHISPVDGGSAGGGYWADLFPGAIDWSHTNALAVDPDGGVTLSLRYQSALVHVVGDPAAADFGAVSWILVGDPEKSVLTSTLAFASSTGIADVAFEQQHHVASVAGGLTLWDNGREPESGSRVLELAISGGAADAVREWPVGAFCPGQGSGTVLRSGNVLVDCAPADTIAEVDPAGVTLWSASVSCGLGMMLRPLYRGLPIDLFPAAGASSVP